VYDQNITTTYTCTLSGNKPIKSSEGVLKQLIRVITNKFYSTHRWNIYQSFVWKKNCNVNTLNVQSSVL
jgi:ABC-type antimicrobial peptide transport system ATPase subunit